MKHADSLKPTETLYESRLFEALHRVNPRLIRHIRRQQRIRCKGCPPSSKHRIGKLWIADFYIWPRVIIEVDGHDPTWERDECFHSRGLYVVHIRNSDLYEIEQAEMIARNISAVLESVRLIRDLLHQFGPSTRREIARMMWLAAGLDRGEAHSLIYGGFWREFNAAD